MNFKSHINCGQYNGKYLQVYLKLSKAIPLKLRAGFLQISGSCNFHRPVCLNSQLRVWRLLLATVQANIYFISYEIKQIKNKLKYHSSLIRTRSTL